MKSLLHSLRQAYIDEIEVMASAKQLGWLEFVIRHGILLVLNFSAVLMFDVIFPAYWFVTYLLLGLGTRWAVSRLGQAHSFSGYLLTLTFYTLRMVAYRVMILYLWFHEEVAAQFPAICMIMAGILFSLSQATRIRSYVISQGAGDSVVLLIIAMNFLLAAPLTPDMLISGLCTLGVMLYHAASLREMQTNRKAAQDLEIRTRQSQKMEAVGRLTGGVAHDFNNILTVVMGNLDLYSEVSSDTEREDLVAKAHAAAARASTLTSQLLAFSRQAPLQTTTIETGPFVENAHMMTERVLPATISLILDAAPDVWDMEVDQNQLEVALLNLIINARDAMPNGGTLQLIAKNHAPSDRVTSQRKVALELIDDGEGIAPDILERVFDPFFTTKPVGKGSGLGLSMVKGFVEQSGGELSITSTPGSGTRVCMLIPAAQDRDAAPYT